MLSGLRSRFLLVASIVPLLGVLLVALAGYWLYETTMRERREALRYATEAAVTAVAQIERRVSQGELTLEQGKSQALDILSGMRFRDGEEYFYVWDLITLRGIMNPARPEFLGMDGRQVRNRSGAAVIVQLHALAQQEGRGYVTYGWPRPWDPTGPDYEKIGYVVAFKPWGWMIGSGIYADDINRDFMRLAGLFTLAAIGMTLVSYAGTLIWGRRLAAPLEILGIRVSAMGDGQLDQPAPFMDRRDELGKVAQSLDRLRCLAAETMALRQTAEERLHALSRNMAALDAAGDGIDIFNSAGKLVYANPAMARMLGYPNSDECLNSKTYCPLQDWFFTAVMPILAEKSAWAGEVEFTGMDGRMRLAEARYARLPEGDIIGIMRDVTEDREMAARLHQSEKMEAIGRLAGGIAHDFNNLLGAILGFAAFLEEDLPDGSPTRNFAGRITKAGLRAKELVEQILAYSRARGIERTAVDVGAIISELERLLSHTLPASTRLQVLPSASTLTARANATQMVQLLMNLCVNASEALDGDRGSITIEAAPATAAELSPLTQPISNNGVIRDEDGEQITVRLGHADPSLAYIRLSVTDDGPGVPPSIAGQLFDPFFTTKSGAGGTGLGLSVVKGVVANHDGVLRMQSRLGTGTRVDVFIPTADAGLGADAEGVVSTLPAGTRVLIVDDNVDVADMVSISLERLGCEVAVCNGGEEALEAFSEAPAAWDVLITDQVMPDMKGTDLIRQVRLLRPDIAIILATGYSETLSDEQARAAGADLFLHKPVTPADMATAIGQLLRQRGFTQST